MFSGFVWKKNEWSKTPKRIIKNWFFHVYSHWMIRAYKSHVVILKSWGIPKSPYLFNTGNWSSMTTG